LVLVRHFLLPWIYLELMIFTCLRRTSGWSCCFFHLFTTTTPLASYQKRINFNLATVTYKAMVSESPAYLSFLLIPYNPARTLRSSHRLLLQRFLTKSNFGSRAFCFAAPVWNLLPFLSGLLVLYMYLPLNVLSNLTISSLPFTHPSTSRPHHRLRFYFRHLRFINLYYYYYFFIFLKFF